MATYENDSNATDMAPITIVPTDADTQTGREGRMRRRDLDGKYPIEIEGELKPGEYAKALDGQLWVVRAPNGDIGSLRRQTHQIIEEEDGTLTVSPSIQFETGHRFHGYLKRGVWTT